MKKNILIAILSFTVLIQFSLYYDFVKINFKLKNLSHEKYVKNSFMCGDYSQKAIDILKDNEIKSYMAIYKLSKDEYHASVLIGYDPQSNAFSSLQQINELVDVCDEKGNCLIGKVNDNLNLYYK